MSRKDLAWEVTYYLIVLIVWWLTTRDGPPLRVEFWYRTSRTCQYIARYVGQAGFIAERNYYRDLERTHL